MERNKVVEIRSKRLIAGVDIGLALQEVAERLEAAVSVINSTNDHGAEALEDVSQMAAYLRRLV